MKAFQKDVYCLLVHHGGVSPGGLCKSWGCVSPKGGACPGMCVQGGLSKGVCPGWCTSPVNRMTDKQV